MKNEIEQIAQQNDMSIEFVTWFFNEKKSKLRKRLVHDDGCNVGRLERS
ncbi:TPA: hypothetical protein ACX14I_001409 [Klebsiella pneumoniae]